MVEVLEGRDCPAVSVTFSDGTLRVTGDDGPNQVGIVELGGAVVKINADGEQFPSFAGVQSMVVETLGGNDRVEYGPQSPAVVSAMGDRQLSIDVGAGDDVVVMRDPAPVPTGTVRDLVVTFQGRLNLGTGRDFVRAEVGHACDVSLDVVSADGGDDIGAAIRPPGQVKWAPIELKRGVVAMDLGAGGNRVSVATSGVDDVAVDLTTSDRGGTPSSGPGDRVALTFDNPSVDQPHTLHLAVKLRGNSRDEFFADDRVTVDSSGFADVSADIDTGAGNDWVTVRGKYLTARPRPSDAPAHLAFGARLGDGDDRLDAQFAGYDAADLGLDLGAGNDRGNVQTGTWIADVSYERSFNVDAQLGGGDDAFRLFTRGYDVVNASLNTGPEGDGRDEVAAAFVRPGETNARRRNLVSLLSADLDRFQILGVGYADDRVVLEGDQCLVFFAAGGP